MSCERLSQFKGEAALTYSFNKGPASMRHKDVDSLMLRPDEQPDQGPAIKR